MKKAFPQVQIMSREGIEELAKLPFSKRTAVISITDADYFFAELENQPAELLQVAFDDVDNDVFEDELGRAPNEDERLRIEKKYNMLSDEQAKEIADFCLKVMDSVDVIICHCEHGQSRSAAVAAAIIEHTTRDGIKIFADDMYFPNKVVFRKVYAALNDLTAINKSLLKDMPDFSLHGKGFEALRCAGDQTDITEEDMMKLRTIDRQSLEELINKSKTLGLTSNYESVDINNIPIEALNLSAMAYNRLKRSDIHTIDIFINIFEKEGLEGLLKNRFLRKLGGMNLKEVIAKLGLLGLLK